MQTGLILYNLRGCPFCRRVKQHLKKLDLEYTVVQVPRLRPMRREVKRLSGQVQVPIMLDGDTVIADSKVIIEYLNAHYRNYEGTQSDAPAPV